MTRSRPLSLRAALLIAALLPLTACVSVQNVADQLAREQARQFVNAEVAQRFPGVNVTPISNCVINNASAQEILTIAGGTAFGDTATASTTVGTILQRPETLQCASGNVLEGLLRGLL